MACPRNQKQLVLLRHGSILTATITVFLWMAMKPLYLAIVRMEVFTIAVWLQLLSNRCIETGKYPECLKTAKVLLFFKNGNKYEPWSFWQILFLPITEKNFERIIFDQNQNNLKAFEIHSDSQFGFRHGKNTFDDIATLKQDIRSNHHNNSDRTKCNILDPESVWYCWLPHLIAQEL